MFEKLFNKKQKREYKCKKCKDTKKITCPACLGTGYFYSHATQWNFYYNQTVCFNCKGTSLIECPHCKSPENEPVEENQNSTMEEIVITSKNGNISYSK